MATPENDRVPVDRPRERLRWLGNVVEVEELVRNDQPGGVEDLGDSDGRDRQHEARGLGEPADEQDLGQRAECREPRRDR